MIHRDRCKSLGDAVLFPICANTLHEITSSLAFRSMCLRASNEDSVYISSAGRVSVCKGTCLYIVQDAASSRKRVPSRKGRVTAEDKHKIGQTYASLESSFLCFVGRYKDCIALTHIAKTDHGKSDSTDQSDLWHVTKTLHV